MCVLTLATAWWVAHSRLGLGLFAIHDDEDVAEAKGVPTFRYKIAAFALSAGIAGAVGGIHAMYVGFITVAGTFELTVPLYVVLMSVLGGSRHWLGPAIGATAITALLYAFISGGEAMMGRAIVGLILIVAILWLPDGVIPAIQAWLKRRRTAPVTTRARSGAGRSGGSTDDQRALDPAGEGRHQALRRPAGAGRRRPRRARGRDPRPGRAQRLGQDHADQRDLGLLSADQRHHHARRRRDRPRSRRTRSPAAAWRAPIRSRGRSPT